MQGNWNGTEGDCVSFDPRDATPELGAKCFQNAVENLHRLVQDVYSTL